MGGEQRGVRQPACCTLRGTLAASYVVHLLRPTLAALLPTLVRPTLATPYVVLLLHAAKQDTQMSTKTQK